MTADAAGLQAGEQVTATLLVTTANASRGNVQSVSVPVLLSVGDVWHASLPAAPAPDPDPGPGDEERQIYVPVIRRP